MKFAEIKEQTANDCEQLAKLIRELASEVRDGNIDAFLRFFFEGGTEEGDAKLYALREMILIRYFKRAETEEVKVSK